MIQQLTIYLGPSTSNNDTPQAKAFCCIFLHEKHFHRSIHRTATPETLYTRLLYQSFLIIAQAVYTGNNFTATTLPHQKQKFLFTKRLCHQRPMIHPYYHTNHDPRMNCQGLYAKCNFSVRGYFLRMQFGRDVLQERKCDIVPVTLNAPMPKNRCTCHKEWHTNITKECTCHEE